MKGRAAKAKYTFTEHQILDTEIGWDVMSDWEDPIMVKHGEIVTKNGGDILEFGFGMGISATHIQSHDINSHTIIEINDDVYEKLLIWAEDKPNVITIKGDWADSIPNKQYDAIFYDPYGDMKKAHSDGTSDFDFLVYFDKKVFNCNGNPYVNSRFGFL